MFKFKRMLLFIPVSLAFALSPSLEGVSFAYENLADLQTTNIQNNETVTIAYLFMGCFHSNLEKYIITANGLKISGALYPLSWKDREKIDELIASWAALPKDIEARCTTTSDLYVTRRRNDEVVASERFNDGNCTTPYGLEKIVNTIKNRDSSQSTWTDVPQK